MTPPSPPDGDVTVGELGRWLNRVDKQLVTLTTEIRDQRAEYVHRTEWTLHLDESARQFHQLGAGITAAKAEAAASVAVVKADVGAEVKALRSDISARRIPWTAVVAAIAAMISLGLTLLKAAPPL